MDTKRWLAAIGFAISLILVALLLTQLDWTIFAEALTYPNYQWIVVAGFCTAIEIAIRTLRWHLLTGEPLTQYRHFCLHQILVI